MKKIIISILFLVALLSISHAQSSLSNFELRAENGQLTSASTYQFDIYLYNTGTASFELRAGTASFWINPSWRNSGTITPSISSSGLVTAQQSGTSAYTNGSPDFFRRTIANVSSGSGTSVSAGSRVKLFTVLFTNSTTFSTTATPNFACKFSGTNTCGFTYTDTVTTASAIAVNATTVTSTQSNCHTPVYWTGTQWNAGSTSGAAASTSSPTSSKDVVIYTGTASGTLSCRNYYLPSGCTHTLGIGTLSVAYNLVNSGTLSAASGSIVLNGSSVQQTQNQSVSGNSITVANLEFGASGQWGTKTLSTSVDITGALTQAGTATLATGGYLTLKSSGSGTARIGQLSSSAVISGNITVERNIPSSFRRYRFLASPVVGGTTLQWRDNGATRSGWGIQITNTSGTVDPSTTNQPSAFKYNEASTAGGSDINAKWETIDGNTALTNGQGYRIYVRGDRTKSLTTSGDTSPNETTIWVSGTHAASPVSLPVTYNAGLGEGWNLVGNPFPSPIDWNAASGWTKTNVMGTIWIWNPVVNAYGSWDGITPVNSATQYIASGQGFFVKAIASSPDLTLTEAVKVSNAPASLFKAPEINTLRIRLNFDTIESDETVIRFMENKSNNFVVGEDVLKITNPSINLGSYMAPDKYVMTNYLNPNSLNDVVVPLSASVTQAGSFPLVFSQLSSFDPSLGIYLRDKRKNILLDLHKNNTYVFVVDSSPASVADGRLEVIFSNKPLSQLEHQLQQRQLQVSLTPNPVNDRFTLTVSQAAFSPLQVVIYNMSGIELERFSMQDESKQVDVSHFEKGVYLLQFSDPGSGFSRTLKFVK